MKRRIITILAAIALCASLMPTASAAGVDRGVLMYEQLIAPQYDDARFYSEGLAPVKKDGKWGYIDMNNNIIIDFKYDVANPFSEGYAVVGDYADSENWEGEIVKYVKLGFIDATGNYKPFRRDPDSFGSPGPEDGYHYLYAKSEWGQYDYSYDYCFYGGWVFIGGLFDADGNQFVPAPPDTGKWYDCWPLKVPTEGLIPCGTAHYGTEAPSTYVDLNSNVVIDFFEKFTYYDAYGEQTTEGSSTASYFKCISNVFPFNQGLAGAWECTVRLETWEYEYRFGFINKSGAWVIQPQYESYYFVNYNEYRCFSGNGLASVEKDGKFGAIDKTGKVIIPFQYDRLQSFYEGLAVFELDGKCGYLDVSGDIAIPALYEEASGFENGLAVVYNGSKAYIIDRYGNAVPGADQVNPDSYFKVLSDGMVVTSTPDEYLVVNVDGKYGFGKISYEPLLPKASEMDSWAYEEVVSAIEADLVPARLQNMYRGNISRLDYSILVVNALCAILEMERDDLVKDVTGKGMGEWMKEYPFTDTFNSDIIAAYALGLVTGYANGTFLPYNQISRQEAAVLLWRAAGVLGMDRDNPPQSGFADRGSIPDWAVKEVDYVNAIGVMNGTSPTSFSPTSSYTRQQSYMTIWRLLQAMLAEKR
ncbi:MAG: WG repeat-containing protein [Oscillospiraceae bacterium]|nr:WG repeat-containing protein [Oscillospiraceae bacterium]